MKSLFLFVLILFISIQFSGCMTTPPFYMAMYEGNVKKVTKLLNEGEDINQNSTVNAPIVYAAGHGQFDIVRLLIERGANVNAQSSTPNGSYTTLMHAIRRRNDDIARLLIEKGANLNAIDAEGLSALGWAAIKDNDPMINLLIDRGADIDIAITGLEVLVAKVPAGVPILAKLKKIKNEKEKGSHGKD